jgi:hypothetical protein
VAFSIAIFVCFVSAAALSHRIGHGGSKGVKKYRWNDVPDIPAALPFGRIEPILLPSYRVKLPCPSRN